MTVGYSGYGGTKEGMLITVRPDMRAGEGNQGLESEEERV